jgi:hypothetical protein
MISAAEEEAKWPHLHAAIRTSEMEEAARQEAEEAEDWELYAQARQARREVEEAARREEARRRADEERLDEQRRRQEARRRAWQERQQRLREALLRAPPQPRVAPDPHSPWEEALWSPWPESPARSSHNSASPPGQFPWGVELRRARCQPLLLLF